MGTLAHLTFWENKNKTRSFRTYEISLSIDIGRIANQKSTKMAAIFNI